MHVAVMQPYFFPYVGYYQLAGAVDQMVFLDDVTFINRGWINRNRILVDGRPHLFTVPLLGASQNKLIKDIGLADARRWKARFLKQLAHSYARAPMFEEAYQRIDQWVSEGMERISTLAAHSISGVMSYLGKPITPTCSSDLAYDRGLKGQQRILEICRTVGATTYLNPPGGVDLYESAQFQASGVEWRFLQPNAVSYHQGRGVTFVPNLSMIDLLMFNTPEQIAALLCEYRIRTREEVDGTHGYAVAADHTGRL
jgi:hypothetical protein